MNEPLINMYNPSFFEALCPLLERTIPGFESRDFIYHVFNRRWPDLEFEERAGHIALVLHHFLPKDFRQASTLLVSLSEALQRSGICEQGSEALFIADYIQIFGAGYPEESLAALEQVTKLVSADVAD